MVPAKNFVQTLAANVDNVKLSDAEFREFVRNTIDIVEGVVQQKTGDAPGYQVPHTWAMDFSPLWRPDK